MLVVPDGLVTEQENYAQNTEHRALVGISGAKVRNQVIRALVSMGCQADACDVDKGLLRKELKKCKTTQGHSIYVVDVDADPETAHWFLKQLPLVAPEAIVLAISSDVDNHFLLNLLKKGVLSNLIARHGGMSASHDTIDEAELITTLSKLLHRDIFGLKKYLSTFGIQFREEFLDNSEQIDSVSHKMSKDLKDMKCSGGVGQLILTVFNELLTNALYNAPRTPTGTSLYADRDRAEGVFLEKDEEAQVSWGCDGKYFGISVSDNFGGLDRSSIVKYLQEAFLGQKAAPEYKEGGAGLGLYMVFNSITQLVFNIHEDKRTEVIALFYIRGGMNGFKNSNKSLNMFILKDKIYGAY